MSDQTTDQIMESMRQKAHAATLAEERRISQETGLSRREVREQGLVGAESIEQRLGRLEATMQKVAQIHGKDGIKVELPIIGLDRAALAGLNQGSSYKTIDVEVIENGFAQAYRILYVSRLTNA